ncbi:MAG: hypothetical protein GY898_21105 [Proteobacteria bacterium]|nr:hypothetical protein [Pseudomonadota bacterium]
MYLATFWLGSHGWIWLLLAGAWLLTPAPRAAKVFVVGAVVLWNVYVAKVGGDFMYGCFFVTLLAVAAEALAHRVARSERTLGAAAAGLLLASSVGEPITEHGTWGIVDESGYYPVEGWHPVRVGSAKFDVGLFFAETLHDRGIRPTLGSGGIGMMGYYSRLPIIDVLGLTDVTVARAALTRRGRPGHEKRPPEGYLAERGGTLLRGKSGMARLHPERFRDLAVLRLRPLEGRDPWLLLR